jgi:hypothetical protein
VVPRRDPKESPHKIVEGFSTGMFPTVTDAPGYRSTIRLNKTDEAPLTNPAMAPASILALGATQALGKIGPNAHKAPLTIDGKIESFGQ